MRFHMGVSFSLRKLKKFLFPILIGLLTYFGLNVFTGFIQVHAYENYDTYYNLDYSTFDSIDFSQPFNSNTSLSLQDVLDYGYTESQYFNIITFLGADFNGNYSVYFYLIPKEYTSWSINVNGTNSTSVEQRFQINTKYNLSTNVYFYTKSLSASSSSSTITDTLNNLTSCLNSNNPNYCGSAVSISYIGWQKLPISTPFQTSLSYNVYDSTYRSNANYMYIPYLSQVDLITSERLRSDNNNYFFKGIKINDVVYNVGQEFPTYVEYNNSPSNDSSFTIFDIEFRSLYANFYKGSYNTINIQYEYNVNDVIEYRDNIDNKRVYFIGREFDFTNQIYKYSDIECTYQVFEDFDTTTNLYRLTYSDFACQTNLSSYDKLYFYNSLSYKDDTKSKFIYNLKITTNADSYYYGNYLGSLYENFDSLSRGFQLLLSSDNQFNSKYVNIISDNPYIAFDRISNEDSSLNISTNGDFYNTCQKNGVCYQVFGNVVYGKNLLIYDDTSYSSATETNLKLFLTTDTILSFRVNDTFSYYDNNGDLVNNQINITYDNVDNNSYDLNYYFNKVNDYIDSLNSDLLEFHDLLQVSFDSLDSTTQLLLELFYILSLTYLIFKVIRK